MSEVTLLFADHDTGERLEVHCARMQVLAPDVKVDDYVACPFVGFIHVHGVRLVGRAVYLLDCHDHEHIYKSRDLLEVARPHPEEA